MKKLIAAIAGLAISLTPMATSADEVAVPISVTSAIPIVTAEYEFRNQALFPTARSTFTQRSLSRFQPADRGLNTLHQNQIIETVLASPDADKFICTGIRLIGQPMSENIKLRQRAKAACEYAKFHNPNLSIWYQSKPTKVASFNGRVLLVAKTPIQEPTNLATCTKGANETVMSGETTNGNYVCAEPIFDAADPDKMVGVDVSVVDANGVACENSVNPDCTGYYLGWRMSFNDDDRTIDYSGPKTRISGLQPGDSGAFQLMYQETPQTVHIDVTLRDQNGVECSSDNPDCFGYYIGWDMNFLDELRVVSYSPGTRISGLQPGDAGQLLLMYQASPESDVIRVAGYEFSYQPGSSVISCGDASRETVISSTVSTRGNYVCAVIGATRP